MKHPISTPRVQAHRARRKAEGRRPLQVTVTERDRELVRGIVRMLNAGGAVRARLVRMVLIVAAETLYKQKVELPR